MNRNDVLDHLTIASLNPELDPYTRAFFKRAGDIIIEGRRAQTREDEELLITYTAGLIEESDDWFWKIAGWDNLPDMANAGYADLASGNTAAYAA